MNLSVKPRTGRMWAWKIWNITGFLNAARSLILLDILRLFRLWVSRNKKFYSIMVLWDKKYKNGLISPLVYFIFSLFLTK